jgi:hypothetical protein
MLPRESFSFNVTKSPLGQLVELAFTFICQQEEYPHLGFLIQYQLIPSVLLAANAGADVAIGANIKAKIVTSPKNFFVIRTPVNY